MHTAKGYLQHERGTLAPQLEELALHPGARDLSDARAHPARARETDHVDIGRRHERLATLGRGAGHDIDHPGGKADILKQRCVGLVIDIRDLMQADFLVFTKWDRFSRNAPDAYGMISTLNKLGIEPQAIEQPLDLNIPENKIMLAFYSI